MLKKLDIYIIKKVLGAYVLSLLMIISIAIVIDITEKMDDFYNENLTFYEVVMQYYIHFVPYYANLFSPLFTFISVIFITSKLAFHSEIIAMLAGGISFARIIRPYMIAAAVIALFTFYIGGWVIPPGNDQRLTFESVHVDHLPPFHILHNVQLMTAPGEIVYMERYDLNDSIGYMFSLDRFDSAKVLKSRLTARVAKFDSANTWTVRKYLQREFVGMREISTKGDTMQLNIDMHPSEFVIAKNHFERLTNPQLKDFIQHQEERGRAGLNNYKLEFHKRFAGPFGSFLLAFIGVCVASRKVRGGTGLHMFIGLALSVVYILCTLLSSILTSQASVNPALAIWLPSLVFACVGAVLYVKAQK
ncbi:MAG: LptF/LptG family permease [Paludibacteraceae bacterium]|nr:LptF/LptG family permease [Paludibacteraceae bacterium]